MVNSILSWLDLVLPFIYIPFFYLAAFLFVKIRKYDKTISKHFYWGLTLKLIGSIAFVCIYAFYYKTGDTFYYFRNAQTLVKAILNTPENIPELLLSSRISPERVNELNIKGTTIFFRDKGGYIVTRISALLSFLSFGSFVIVSLWYAFLSYFGIWALFRTVMKIFPTISSRVAIPILYFPSVFFWGSGIMKDTLSIGFLGLLVYSCYFLFFKAKKVLFSILLIIVSGYVIFLAKEYIIFAFVPALIIWLTLGPINKLPNFARYLFFPFFIFLALIFIVSLAPVLGKVSEQYALDQVLQTAETTANWITINSHNDASAYSLGNISFTPLGVLQVFPRAVFVTLFQPFIFEANNPVMLFSALESSFLLGMTIFVWIKVGFTRYVSIIFQNPFLFAALTFSIIFAFAVGISSFNYGTLVRYKLPCIPFYGIAMLVPYLLQKKIQRNNS